MDMFEAELHAIALRCSTEFRVLRKLARREYCERPLGPRTKIGLIVDVETTGLDTGPDGDEIIEVGLEAVMDLGGADAQMGRDEPCSQAVSV